VLVDTSIDRWKGRLPFCGARRGSRRRCRRLRIAEPGCAQRPSCRPGPVQLPAGDLWLERSNRMQNVEGGRQKATFSIHLTAENSKIAKIRAQILPVFVFSAFSAVEQSFRHITLPAPVRGGEGIRRTAGLRPAACSSPGQLGRHDCPLPKVISQSSSGECPTWRRCSRHCFALAPPIQRPFTSPINKIIPLRL
jgi:hypothetical protein